MVKVIIQGIHGRMGIALCELIALRNDCEVVAGVDSHQDENSSIPIYVTAEDISIKADVLIDFSRPDATAIALTACEKKKIACVICTTGLTDETLTKMKEVSKNIPVFYSANMSIGINVLLSLVKQAASLLPNFDIEIIEKHHRNKLDAPSGTALMIADAINSVEPEPYAYQYNRQPLRQVRPKDEIGIHAVRGGTIVGEHEVLFAGSDEVLNISHAASSRNVFANGAIEAAVFLATSSAGLYSMEDMIEKTLRK